MYPSSAHTSSASAASAAANSTSTPAPPAPPALPAPPGAAAVCSSRSFRCTVTGTDVYEDTTINKYIGITIFLVTD